MRLTSLLTATAKIRAVDADGAYEGFFGEDVAATYDAGAAAMFDPALVDPVVDLLARLAGAGRALELAIGTGRIALPLAARGVSVAGIDDSEAMVARLRAKPGGNEIEVAIGTSPRPAFRASSRSSTSSSTRSSTS